MQGDFSVLYFDPNEHEDGVDPLYQGVLRNISGVLHQQGRVITDVDLTEGELLKLAWNGQAGRDIIGAGVCAVPAAEPQSFRIESALVSGGEVHIKVLPGRAWVDGILTRLTGTAANPSAAVERRAHYFGPPLANPLPQPSSIGDDTRDAVVLEVSEEAVHGFQYPERLIEPALGGPDTSERSYVNVRFRLLRLVEGEDCASILDRLKGDPTTKGKLSVSLAPVTVIAGDCPVVGGGGYLGFEHNLYRIEIADGDPSAPVRFKWSQWNGGLVGRGVFQASPSPARVIIDAGRAAIVNCGLTEFYIEALQYDELDGTWNVVYGTTATLNTEHDLELATPPTFGTLPATTNPVFFRLWNGLRDIADFTNVANPVELRDGIRLVFDAPGAGKYQPRDYWTFTVRAGEIPNQPLLLDQAPPTGIIYHRVPLAEINWIGRQNTTVFGSIEDCREIFDPLTRLATCCTRRVGDGVQSHGEFDSIQAAIDSLPPEGGQVCVLPGTYTENVRIENRREVTISGCGKRSRWISNSPQREFERAEPVIRIINSFGVRIESLLIEAHATGYGILAESQAGDPDSPSQLPLRDLMMVKLFMRAATRSAIEVRAAQFVIIECCEIEMRDVAGSWPGIFVTADDVRIERNSIQVHPQRRSQIARSVVPPTANGLGGLQIGGTSERVRIIDNLIQGGRGNGITLGSVVVVNDDDQDIGTIIAWPIHPDDPCQPCRPGDSRLPDPQDTIGIEGRRRTRSAGSLYDIHLERNRIFDMGMNGIGVAAFFNLDGIDEFISVERLNIVSNLIRGCLQRQLAPIDAKMINSIGYGGIQLADVSYLVIRENIIEDNGPSHLDPICGIFVLHGEGIDISSNRILNNGAKTTEPVRQVKGGRRSGIHIAYCIAPKTAIDLGRFSLPVQNGVPALKVHNNNVSQPLGQALAAVALGPVSVQGNQFTSRGVVLRSEPPSPTFLGATVLILNLGLSNEAYWQLLAFSGIKNGQFSSRAVSSTNDNEVVIPQPGLDDRRIGQYLANGNVLFSDNQCVLDLIERGMSLAYASIVISSLDDIGFSNNQCDCNLLDDVVLSQAILNGFSLRVSDNRFKEGIYNALYSAITLGVANTTTDNQSTHCLLIRGWTDLTVNQPNTVLLAGANQRFCESYGRILSTFGKRGVSTHG
jgi:hypothetical protein